MWHKKETRRHARYVSHLFNVPYVGVVPAVAPGRGKYVMSLIVLCFRARLSLTKKKPHLYYYRLEKKCGSVKGTSWKTVVYSTLHSSTTCLLFESLSGRGGGRKERGTTRNTCLFFPVNNVCKKKEQKKETTLLRSSIRERRLALLPLLLLPLKQKEVTAGFISFLLPLLCVSGFFLVFLRHDV